MSRRHGGSPLLLLLVFFSDPSMGQGPPPSVIPQPDVPVIPGSTIVHRSQAQVQQNSHFSLPTATLVVSDATVGPSDWSLEVSSPVKSGFAADLNYEAELRIPLALIPPMLGAFAWKGELEVPAKKPFGVVGIPPDISKTEQMPNPAVKQMLPKPKLVSAKDDYSYTTKGTNHKSVKVWVVAKFVQKEPDAANGGQLRVELFLYNKAKSSWDLADGTVYNPVLYQCSIMEDMKVALHYEYNKNDFLITKDNGDVVVQWKVVLTNGNRQVVYGHKDNELVVWSNRTPSPPGG